MRLLGIVLAFAVSSPALADGWATMVVDAGSVRSVTMIGQTGNSSAAISCTGYAAGVAPNLILSVPATLDFSARKGDAATLRAESAGQVWTWSGLVVQNDSRGTVLEATVADDAFALAKLPAEIRFSAESGSVAVAFDVPGVEQKASAQFMEACA